jgi:hypothetical protein
LEDNRFSYARRIAAVVDPEQPLPTLTGAPNTPPPPSGNSNIRTLLNMQDAMVERYGFPDDLPPRWEAEKRPTNPKVADRPATKTISDYQNVSIPTPDVNL